MSCSPPVIASYEWMRGRAPCSSRYFSRPRWLLSPDVYGVSPESSESVDGNQPVYNAQKISSAPSYSDYTANHFLPLRRSRYVGVDRSCLGEKSIDDVGDGWLRSTSHDLIYPDTSPIIPSPSSIQDNLWSSWKGWARRHNSNWSKESRTNVWGSHGLALPHKSLKPKTFSPLICTLGLGTYDIAATHYGDTPSSFSSSFRVIVDNSPQMALCRNSYDEYDDSGCSSGSSEATEEIVFDRTTLKTISHQLSCSPYPLQSFSSPLTRRPEKPSLGDDAYHEFAKWISTWMCSFVKRFCVEEGLSHVVFSANVASSCSSAATEIHCVLKNLSCPDLTSVLALWYMCRLLQTGTRFEKITLLKYLYQHGACTLHELIYGSFVTAAMLADKWLNDAPLTAKTWSALTLWPLSLLNGLDIHALKTLDWSLEISGNDWAAWLRELRASQPCITQWPSETSPVVFSILDQLAFTSCGPRRPTLTEIVMYSSLNDSDNGSLHSDLKSFVPFSPFDKNWRPEADPVVQKQARAENTAPGASRHFTHNIVRVGITALDILQSIISSKSPSSLSRRVQNIGIGHHWPFGAIGGRPG